VAVDKNGNVWFTEPNTDAIGEFDPQSQNWNQWSLAKGSEPFDLIFDSAGNLWFTEFGSNKIGFFNTRTDQVVETAVPTPRSNPYGLTVDPAGTIWFAEDALGIDQIASFTPTSSGIIKIVEHATAAIRPHLIAADRQGNIWYSGGFGANIGEFNPRSGASKLFVVYNGVCVSPCTGTHISGIDVDSKGNIWFTDSLSQRVGYFVPSTGQVAARTIHVNNSHPHDGLFVDQNNRIWFTEEFGLTLDMWPASSVK
jgi:virginiamycin B lyase